MKTFGKFVLTLTGFSVLFLTTAFATTNTLQVFDQGLAGDFGVPPATHVDPVIKVGDTVQWVWANGNLMQHSATAAAGQAENWDSGLQNAGFTFTHTFTHSGTFNYYCTNHGFDNGDTTVSGMSGHVTVQNPGGVIYFDDFQQFPNGTVLTVTNYLPNIGVAGTINTNDNNGGASTTVVASNLLGSVRAFFNQASVPYQHKYRGDQLGGELTNQSITLAFKLWVAQTKSVSSIGGIGIDLTTTNINSINQGVTNYDNNPLILINDGGQIFVFTNNPVPPAHLNTVQIGNWGSLAGSIMTNSLTVDYADGTYAFSLNGNVLTNAPIPKFITNIFDRIRIEIFEGLSGAGTLNSAGNKFALDDVRLTSGTPSTNLDVKNFIAAAKGQMFEQLSAGAPSMATTGFQFHADVRGVESNSIVAASVQPPTGGSQSLVRKDPSSSQLEFNDQFTTKTALDNMYHSSGTYTMSIDTQNQGTLAPALNLPADAYPTTPQILNFTAGQSINSATNFIVTWSAFSGGTSTDFITFELDDSMGMTITNTPDIFDPGALDGTATSVTIPGGTLAAGTTFNGRILFVKGSNRDTNSVPGAIGATGYFKQTFFVLATAPAPGVSCSLAPALATNDVDTTHTVTATILSNGTALVGATVDFDVINGPGLGKTGTGTTDGAGHASFSYSSIVEGIDTIQAVSLSSTCTATKVWLAPNILPVALCHDVTNAANGSCQANVSATQVNDGSFDVDGTIVNYALVPPGPYTLGDTPVTLTVTDDRGGTDSCQATITVLDETAPLINCAGSNVTTNVPHGVTSAVVNYPAPVVSDNCSLTFVDSQPASGSTFPVGVSPVLTTAADAAGNTNICEFSVTVVELPPETHDLALVKLKAPKKITFKSGVTSVVGKFAVSIQNRGTLNETILNMGVLTNLVTVNVQSLSNCPSFFATMLPPKAAFPITLAAKKKLNLAFTATFDCVNDPAATSKTASHSDYQTVATVHHEAIDGNEDTFPADDSCPRNPAGTVPLGTGTTTDKGCVPALTDVIVK